MEWFGGHSAQAVGDFWELYDRMTGASEASAHELEVRAGTPPAGSIAAHVAATRAALRSARDGDWRDFERHLETLADDYATRGLDLAAWQDVTSRFQKAIIPAMVEAFASDVDRLTRVLLVLSDYTARSLAIVNRRYLQRKQRLRQAVEARYAQVIDASPDPVISIDADGVVTAFNAAAERTFGYTADEALHRSLAELVIPERFRERHTRGLANVTAGGPSSVIGARVEMTAMRADGSELPVELAITATTDLDGRPTFTGFLRDLTAQKRAEESTALWSHALVQAEFGIVVSDRASRTIIRANPAYARMLGYEAEVLVGMDGQRLIAPSTLHRLPALARTLRDRGHHTYELNLLRADGSIVPVLASSSPVETSSGAQLLVSTVIDISDRVELERERAVAVAELERSAARLETLSSAAHEFASSSGEVDALLHLVARRLAESVGEACAVRLLSADGAWLEPSTSFYHRDPAATKLARAVLGSERQAVGAGIAGRVAATGEAIRIAELDTSRMLELTVPPFADMLRRIGVSSALAIPLRSHGRTTGVLSMLRTAPGNPYTIDDQHLAQDLADRAGLAIDNAVLVATLERRVLERTAALEAANRELEAFSYSVSHDLRTPLRAIDGFSRALADDYGGTIGAEGRQFLDRIRANTQRMGRLIDALLDLGRIGRVTPDMRVIDLGAIAADIIEELRRHDLERTVSIDIAPGMTVRADTRLVTILLENLIGNAWKFTAKTATASIAIGKHDGAFYVRDNGAGLDMAYAGKLFAPFQRLHLASEFAGEGIGLATVHRIVAHHRGRIWVEAAVGKGATFYFTLGDP